MGRENLSGTAVVALLALGLALTLSACSEMSNGSAESAEVTVSRAKKNVEDPELAFDIQLTDKLPYPLSKNYATGLQFTGMELQSGHKFMRKPPRRPSPGVRVDVIATPSHQKTIRMQMAYAKLRDLFGETEASQSRKKVIWLEDTENQHWFSIGYMVKKADGGLLVNIDHHGMKLGKDLPMKDIGKDDEFYLFFTVSRDAQIDRLNIGDAQLRHTMKLDLPSLAKVD